MNLRSLTIAAAVAALGLAATTASNADTKWVVDGTSSLDGSFVTPDKPYYTISTLNFYYLLDGTGHYSGFQDVDISPPLFYFPDNSNFTVTGENPSPGVLDITGGGTLTISSVPEPASWALMTAGVGMAGAGMRLARRRKTSGLSAA